MIRTGAGAPTGALVHWCVLVRDCRAHRACDRVRVVSLYGGLEAQPLSLIAAPGEARQRVQSPGSGMRRRSGSCGSLFVVRCSLLLRVQSSAEQRRAAQSSTEDRAYDLRSCDAIPSKASSDEPAARCAVWLYGCVLHRRAVTLSAVFPMHTRSAALGFVFRWDESTRSALRPGPVFAYLIALRIVIVVRLPWLALAGLGWAGLGCWGHPRNTPPG
jgi:hypothetical protein